MAEDSVWIVPTNEIIQKGITQAQEAHHIFGVNTVLTGSVQRLGGTTEMILEVYDPTLQTPRVIKTRTVKAPLDSASRSAVINEIVSLLEVPMDTGIQGSVHIGSSTTPDANAFYLQGRGYLQRYDIEGNLDNAIRLFEQALDADSLYASAHVGLCEAFWQQYQSTKAMHLVDQALQHCDRAIALDDQLAAVYVTLGRIYRERGQPQQAERALQQALHLEPNNTHTYRWLGWLYAAERKPDAAESAYKQAIRL